MTDMGLFDTVFIPCPTCHRTIEAQSKSGLCNLDDYTLGSAPVAVVAGLDNEILQCEHCDTKIQIRVQTSCSIEVLR